MPTNPKPQETRRDPVAFCRSMLGVELQPWQKRILRGLMTTPPAKLKLIRLR